MEAKIKESKLLKSTFILTVFSITYLCAFAPLKIFGLICAVLALLMGITFFCMHIAQNGIGFCAKIFILIVVYLILHLIFIGKGSGAYFVAQIIGFLGLFVALSNVKTDEESLVQIRRIIRGLYYCIIIVYLVAYLLNLKAMINTIISPTILKLLLPLSLFAIDEQNKKKKFVEICIFILISFILGERTTVVCMIAIILINTVLKKISYRESCILFTIVMVLVILFPLGYVSLSKSSFGHLLNQWFRQYTGENFFSGRDRIWRMIFEGVKGKVFFGLGFGNQFLEEHGITLSTHNLYMYLYMNGGVVLVGLFSCFMCGIWRSMKKAMNRKDTYALKGASYFLGLLLFLDMELFLLANNVVISLVWWIIIALIFVWGDMKSKQK